MKELRQSVFLSAHLSSSGQPFNSASSSASQAYDGDDDVVLLEGRKSVCATRTKSLQQTKLASIRSTMAEEKEGVQTEQP